MEKFVDQIIEGEEIIKDQQECRQNLLRACTHLKRTLSPGEAYTGLLDVDYFILQIHRITMRNVYNENGKISTSRRITCYNGDTYEYPHFINETVGECALIHLVDIYNKQLQQIKDSTDNLTNKKGAIIMLAAKFMYVYLSLHIFGDGNGRTARLLGAYILKTYFPSWVTPVSKTWVSKLIQIRKTQNITKLVNSTNQAWALVNQLYKANIQPLIEELYPSPLEPPAIPHRENVETVGDRG